jgi:hypothetical protein
VNARLAALLTGAHARAWRSRYGPEFCALLEELPATPASVASAATSALSSRAPAMAAIGAFALAAAVLALGPAASDRRNVTAQTRPARTAKPAVSWNAQCDFNVAYVAPEGPARC